MIKRDYLPRKFQKSGETETPGEDDGVILPLKEYVERAVIRRHQPRHPEMRIRPQGGSGAQRKPLHPGA